MALGDAIREATRRQREAAEAVARAAEQAEQEQAGSPDGTAGSRRTSQ